MGAIFKHPFIVVGLAVVIGIAAFLKMGAEDQRQRDLIRRGVCVETTETRTINTGHMQCMFWGKNGCGSYIWISSYRTERKYQCARESFWR